ncbi:hypothetical protein Cgig2_005217 [Carnegiea gigantea]|uniref:Uncharacterized protein n=1 Tax=Carnegiea gigantea TaxID=171969 RepID=A0A9Q1JVM9_9CARY|nr:hypothetical protein Cgig2_005217 [Carnegiea gigantea]
MAFPRSLDTKAMVEYIVRHFAWDQHGVAFPPLPLPKDFQALCLSYELVVAKEAAEYYELSGRALQALEPALTEPRWSTFESSVWLYGDWIFEARFQLKAGSGESSGAGRQEEGSEVEPEGEDSATERATSPFDDEKVPPFRRKWCNRRGRKTKNTWYAYFPFYYGIAGGELPICPRPLPEDYYVLCPRFLLPQAEGIAADFELPEMVQATFYVMLLNEAVELGVVRGFVAEGLKSALVALSEGRDKIEIDLFPSFANTEQATEYVRDHFRWALRDPSVPNPRPLPSDYHGLCPRFDLEVAMRYAHDSNILEMVSIIFYAMVINNTAELSLSCRLTMDCVMWAMQKVDRGPPAKYVRDNLHRSARETSSLRPNLLPLCFAAYCPEFDHIVAMQFAHAAHIPKMVQAIFYGMVISDAVKLRLIGRETEESLMLDLQKLRWDIIEAWLLERRERRRKCLVSELH